MSIGHYRFALLPGVDAAAFEVHTRDEEFLGSSPFQLTRITSAISSRWLKCLSPGAEAEVENALRPQYVLEVTVTLMGPARYDFQQNVGRLQEAVAGSATLITVEEFRNLESPND